MPITSDVKTISKVITINASLDLVWYAWTISERVAEWFAAETVVEPEIGGLYELYFIPGNKESMNTRGCKITKIDAEKELEFTWKGPDDFKDLMNDEKALTVVNVKFQSINETATKVTVNHTGFMADESWTDAYNWHEMAWDGVLSSLKSALEQGEGNLCCQPL